ncbi:histone chaperone domain CHZ-domain-containing protein [Phialemonium atrogriseum]|uniref:Histone chaperone domain CHZ-domain-containing protein n=1 Tax=Phialemonium atrogriseum TaxID=1093897 RepID=A0AAJ0FLF0_9PEZI|nr:histone chaperone domain CHZ-domain-containing protein [Phialemonium atrogriseum]KAK1772556.1 histone chaperone domain CHZ-domain-containing protein [Phialemonium atrogriseum]
MANENGTTIPQDAEVQNTEFGDSKGKGKAVATEDRHAQDTAMNEDDDDEDEDEEGDEDAEGAEEEEEDGLEEIDLDNVVGRRTRGKVIDFAKAAEELPAENDEDEEDDDDFEGDEGGDRMDED